MFRLLLALCLLMPAFAQQEEETVVLEEFTVTARKQQIDLQEASAAISVVTGEEFEQSNIGKLDNFNGFAPSLMVTKNDGAGRVVSIRGVGWETAQNLSTQPSVLVYVNGVYLANPLALGAHWGEIDHIEVYRGPQGTEFGQSTTGGAINIITKQPDFAGTSGELGVEVGTYSLFRENAVVNLPLNDVFALRLAATKTDRDGFAEIKGGDLDGYELDDDDALTANFAMTYAPNADFSLKFFGIYDDADHHGAAQKSILDPNPDEREFSQDYPSTFALENQQFSAVIDWETPWGVRFRSLTGYQELEKRQSMDGDRLTEDLVSVNLTGFAPVNFDVLPFWDNNSEAFSQEIIISQDGDVLDWHIGLYYLDHENDNFFLEATGPAPFDQFIDVLNNPGPDTLPPFQAPLEFVEDRTVTREDTAIYGQFTYTITDTVALTLGGRFQEDEATDVSSQFWFPATTQETKDDAFTWKAGLDFDLTDNNLLYILASTGWKNGGSNPGALNGAFDVPVIFEPEEVTAFEIGSRNTIADRAYINLTAFYYDYENYQFIQEDPIPFAAGTGSIPEVEIYGLEGETTVVLSDSLRWNTMFSLLDGEIKSDLLTLDTVDFLNSGVGRFLPTSVDDRAALRVNLRGNDPPKLADITLRSKLTHKAVLGDKGTLSSSLEVIHRGEYQYRVFNNPTTDTVPSYTVANLYFGYEFGGLPLKASLSATNLFDEDGVNSRFSNPFGLHTTSEEYIPPQEIIAGLEYRF